MAFSLAACVTAALALGATVLASTAGHSQPAPVADSTLFRRVDSLVAATPGLSGVVAIGRSGRIVHLAAAGAVTHGGPPPTVETALNPGSVT